MSEMEKAQVLHALQKNFDIEPELLQKLLHQISDNNIKNNFSRITKGLTVEDNYRYVFSAMPWIKNINGLHQEQEKSHKESYQVPDYSLLVENSQIVNFPVLVDVKSVSGQKETCEIMPKQLHALRSYSRDHKSPLLIAIYWERLGYWTHNSFANFEGKKSNRISWQTSIKNDLSHIFGDYTFFINSVFYRKTIFTRHETEGSASHKDHGYFEKIYVGRDINSLKEHDIIMSSVIDSTFKAEEIEKTINGDEIIVLEKFGHKMQLIKVSNWLINFINLWKFDLSAIFNDMRITTIARIHMVELMQELGFKNTYLIPTNKNSNTEEIFKLAYDGTGVMADYYRANI